MHQVRDARTTTRMQGRLGQRAGLLLLADGHRCEDGCPRRLGRGEVGSMDLEVSVVACWEEIPRWEMSAAAVAGTNPLEFRVGLFK